MPETPIDYVVSELAEGGKRFIPPVQLITFNQLKAIAIYCPLERLSDATPYLNAAMVEFEIETPLQVAHFIAQTCQESDCYNALEEYSDGTQYEGRVEDLGNNFAGDGSKYKGRSPIMLTGRANYKICGDFFGWNLIDNPEIIADWEHGFKVAGWYWKTRTSNDDKSLNELADADDIYGITRAINGGLNGIHDRIGYLSRAKRALGL